MKKMRKALFLKASPGNISLKINGVKTLIRSGETFIHYYEVVNQLPGIKFLRFIQEESNEKIEEKQNIYQEVVPEQQTKNDSIENTSLSQETSQENTIENNAQEKELENKETNDSSFSHTSVSHTSASAETSCDVQNDEIEPSSSGKERPEDVQINETLNLSINIDYLKEIKKKTNKELLSLSKNELKDILHTANVDISQIKDTRIELYKFLASILKKI